MTQPVEPSITPPSLADQVASAVLSVPGVASLHSGMFGEAATYLPGRRVQGVQLRAEATEVHLTVEWGADIAATADRIRAVVEPLVGNQVHVTVQDLADPTAL